MGDMADHVNDDSPHDGMGPERKERYSTRLRVAKHDLAHKLKLFERYVNGVRDTQEQRPPIAYRLDYANGGVRVETMDESRTVSPRLTKRQLADWLDAGLRTLEEVTRS